MLSEEVNFEQFLQVVVESSTSAIEYGSEIVNDDSPVNADLHFDAQLMHLYAMTEKQVSWTTLNVLCSFAP